MPQLVRAVLIALIAILPAHASRPLLVSDLTANPDKYDRRYVEVSAFISHGFEDFTLFDPLGSDDTRVWGEYGGRVGSNTTYCCDVTAESDRQHALTIDGITTRLVKDRRFRKFDRIIRSDAEVVVHATLRGYFLAGDEAILPGGKRRIGYGHFGLYSLFVIEQVVALNHSELKDLDYRVTADAPDSDASDCFSDGPRVDFEQAVEAQRAAESGVRAWSFTSPEKLVVAQLTSDMGHPVRIVRVIRRSEGRVVYEVAKLGTSERYWATVSRPHWLSFFAKDPYRVAWTLLGTTSCG
jgi:hypothetical protein